MNQCKSLLYFLKLLFYLKLPIGQYMGENILVVCWPGAGSVWQEGVNGLVHSGREQEHETLVR